MRKAVCAFLALTHLFFLFPAVSCAEDISAESYVCMCADTAQVLYGKNEYLHRGIASTTKVMTALIAVESGRLYETVEIDADRIGAEGTSLGLKTGDRLTLYELVKGMLLSSGNDSANAVALFLSGSLEDFAVLMNTRARSIGMYNTNFVTPSGLDADGHYSCAYDMALLSRCAVNDPVIRAMASLRESYVCFEDGRRLFVSNHNKLLSEVEGCVGLKTGYTKKSGRCLLSAALRDGRTVIVVTLGAPDDWNDHKRLYDAAFGVIGSFTPEFISDFIVDVVGGKEQFVECKAQLSSRLSSLSNAEFTAEYYIERFVYAPVNEGDVIGRVVLSSHGAVIDTICVTAQNGVEAYIKKTSFITGIKNSLFELLSKWKITK